MSTIARELADQFLELYQTYYQEDIAELVEHYPSEQQSLYINASDVYQYDHSLLDDWLEQPRQLQQYAEEALAAYDHPIDISLENAAVRLVDPDGGYIERLPVSAIRSKHVGRYVALEGQLASVTGVGFRIMEAVFECQRCGTPTPVPQSRTSFQEPHECQGCERDGPYRLDLDASALVDQRKAKLEEPPEKRTTGSGQSIIVYTEGDLCHVGGENGLTDRSGAPVTVYGTIMLDQSDLDGRNSDPEAGAWLDAGGFGFDGDAYDDIDIDAHRDAFLEHAQSENPVELAAASIAPDLNRDEDLETVLEAAVAWLFNAYRIDPGGSPGSYRGDLHMCLIGDPGLGKSTLMGALSEIAPKCEYRSGTGLTKVGLTAAAVQEEFAGKSEWVLEPGILPRANGGHCIIDEVDAVMDEKTKAIHDAIEGEQKAKIDKAGISADLPTRTAVLASGNPVDGRFDKYEPVAPQIDLDPALVSRMDLVFALKDEPDEERDASKAEHILAAWNELSRKEVQERGRVVEQAETDRTDCPVDLPVLRAWIAYARRNVHPVLTEEADELLRDYYQEARTLNDNYGSNDEQPISATPRTLEAGIRLATAFARVRLSDTVDAEDAERAIRISKQVLQLTFDPDSMAYDIDMIETAVPTSQKERRDWVLETVEELDTDGDGAGYNEVIDRAGEDGLDTGAVGEMIDKLCQAREGGLYKPTKGRLQRT